MTVTTSFESSSNNGGGIFLSNVDDYLAPSQACVNPLFGGKGDGGVDGDKSKAEGKDGGDKAKKESSSSSGAAAAASGGPVANGGGGSVRPRARQSRRGRRGAASRQHVAVGSSSVPDPPREKRGNDGKKDAVTASIADCLACSGCVTTAETVLMEEQHSIKALRQLVADQMRSPGTTLYESDASDGHDGEQRTTIACTISPAAWADMFRHVGVMDKLRGEANQDDVDRQRDLVIEYQRRWTALLHRTLSVSYVLDGNVPLQWSLKEAGDEFCRAYRHRQQRRGHLKEGDNGRNDGDDDEAMTEAELLERQLRPSIALSSTKAQYLLPDGTTKTLTTHPDRSDSESPPDGSAASGHRRKQLLPLISSSCPAVVCLVEKNTHSAVPHLSTTKSPMAMAGTFWRQAHRRQRRIFHLAIMPCHDKKLEASRKDFHNGGDTGTPEKDVDMVITTQECIHLVREAAEESGLLPPPNAPDGRAADKDNGKDSLLKCLESMPLAPFHRQTTGTDPVPHQSRNGQHDEATLIASANASPAGFPSTNGALNNKRDERSSSDPFFTLGSGGYADHVFRRACKELFGVDVPDDGGVWRPVVGGGGGSGSAVSGGEPKRQSARVAAALQRKRDFYEATLCRSVDGTSFSFGEGHGDGNGGTRYTPVLRFAVAYGMQTLQRVLKPFPENDDGGEKVSRDSSSEEHRYDYIEAMACPSGCLNGGGQLRVAERETPTQTRQRVRETQEAFSVPRTSDNVSLELPLKKGSQLHTRYHVVPPLQLSLGATAGVAVKDVQW